MRIQTEEERPMKIREIMTPFDEMVCVTPDTSVVDAAKKMKQADTGVIPVVQADNKTKLVGVITDRDIAVRAVAESANLQSAKVADFMSKGVTAVDPDTDLRTAADTMAEKQLHRLPVVENDKLVGIISLGDLAETQRRQAGKALEGISEGAKAEGRAH
jgi:CBS domain-containing protein